MSSRPSYYDSDEWTEYDDTVRLSAERHGLDVLSTARADGLWEGETEPAGAYTVSGDRDDIEAWAGELAGRYNQDSVMVSVIDPSGDGSLATYGTGGVDSDRALAALQAAGIPGGRVVDGRLQIVSTPDAPVPAAAHRALAARFGHESTDPVSTTFVEQTDDAKRHAPIKELQGIRQRYSESIGLGPAGPLPHLTDADDIAAARHYDAADDATHTTRVQRSYRELRRHITGQYNAMVDAGYTFEPWHGDTEQPYADSAAMLADLRENKHLYFFRTDESGDTGLSADHPMRPDVTVHTPGGGTTRMCANDTFRAVHDAIAHSNGVQSTTRGEKRAWWTHRESLPRRAHLALWNETRAQNVWTNAGPHMQTDDGDGGGVRLRSKGEEGWMPVKDRPFAAQKVVDAPDWMI